MDNVLTIIMVILLGVTLALDSFTVMMARGSQQEKITWTWFWRQGFFLVVMQVVFILLGNLLGLVLAEFNNTFSHLMTLVTIALGVALLLSYIFRRDNLYNLPEEVVTELPWRDFVKVLVLINLDALLAGLIIGLLHVELSIWISLAIAVVSLLTSIIGVRIGYKHGMEKYKIVHSIGLSIVIITIVIIAYVTLF